MIISVENLGKRYTIRHEAGRPSGGYRRLSEDLVSAAKAPFRALASRLRGGVSIPLSGNGATEDFWALRNVSFEVKEGEVLGIIGRNGAGKSTLLKILSRITEPTEGRVTMRGRVASLLEVGTGFHPELTGRENVFLNGTILGMTRAEIRHRFDEIVAFAEIDRFLDTPVKRYSSGMYVRLAFAVAAHLDPEILVVDEVLAVGDAAFQKRCLTKMQDVSKAGRTVLFVSHNMLAVQALCSRAVQLEDGSVCAVGDPSAVVGRYLEGISGRRGVIEFSDGRLELVAASGEWKETSEAGAGFFSRLDIRASADIEELFIDFALENQRGVRLLQIVPKARQEAPVRVGRGQTLVFEVEVGHCGLSPGEYFATIFAHSSAARRILWHSGIPLFKVPLMPNAPECMSPGFTAAIMADYQTNLRVV